ARLALSPSQSRFTSPLPSLQCPPMPLNVGIIGFGRIGVEHSRWLAAADGIRAYAIDDVTPARRALAEHRDLQIYSTIDQLLSDDKVDAVLVSTPTAMH